MGNEQSGAGNQYRADYRHHPSAPARQETGAERQARLERAQQYEDKTKKFNRKDPEITKQEKWKKYAEIDKEKLERQTGNNNNISNNNQQHNNNNNRRIITGSGIVGTATTNTNHTNSTTTASLTAPASLSPSNTPTSSSSLSSSSSHSPLPYDPDPARAARAAAMTAKTAKIKHYKPPAKADQWETYKQLEANKAEQRQAVPMNAATTNLASLSLTSQSQQLTDSASSYGPGVFASVIDEEEDEKQRWAAKLAEENPTLIPQQQQQSNSVLPPTSLSSIANDPNNSAFYQQMFFLISKAQRMPATSLTLLAKILSNLLISDSSADGQKYRRIKLDAERIQRDIVAVDGAVEILIAVGFERSVATNDAGMIEETLICPPEQPLNIAQMALEKIQEIQKMQHK